MRPSRWRDVGVACLAPNVRLLGSRQARLAGNLR